MADKEKELEYQGMNAQDFCNILMKHYPKTFNYWFRFCDSIYNAEHYPDRDIPEEEKVYWEHDILNYATAILYDNNEVISNQIGRILIAATN